MSKLPANLRWKDVAKVLQKLGYKPKRQSVSHLLFVNDEGNIVTVVTKNPIKRGTLEAILDRVAITRERFLELL